MTKLEHWTDNKWRPMMGWTYMVICILDFAAFPILWSLLQALSNGQVTSQWDPITLRGAGLFHISMGAILGVTAWSRGQEKIANIPGSPLPQPIVTTPITTNNVDRPAPVTKPAFTATKVPQPDQGEL